MCSSCDTPSFSSPTSTLNFTLIQLWCHFNYDVTFQLWCHFSIMMSLQLWWHFNYDATFQLRCHFQLWCHFNYVTSIMMPLFNYVTSIMMPLFNYDALFNKMSLFNYDVTIQLWCYFQLWCYYSIMMSLFMTILVPESQRQHIFISSLYLNSTFPYNIYKSRGTKFKRYNY